MDSADAANGSPLNSVEQARFLRSIEQVERAVNQQLQPAPATEAVVMWIHHLHSNMDAVTQRHVQAGAPLHCHQGCGHCCHVRVEALPAEIFRIAQYLREQLSADGEQLLSLVQRLRASVSDGAHAEAVANGSCPFLSAQLCTIYPVRPSVCRKGHSLDVAACASHAPTVPQSLALLADAEALIQGTSRAYRNQGLQSGGHELVAGVLLALTDASAQARWLAGQAVFTDD